MLEHLPGDCGHAANQRDLLTLDDFQRLARVPFVHRDDLVGVHDRRNEVRECARGVEERDGQQRDARRIDLRIAHRDRQTLANEVSGLTGHAVEHIRCDTAMRGQRTLGLTCRAGRVHDRGVIIRADIGIRHRRVGQVGPRLRVADQLLERDDARVSLFLRPARDDDMLELSQIRQMLADTLQLFGVDDSDFRAAVRDAVFQLLARPPGIERRRDRAKHQRGEERDRPLRIIAHDDGDPIALLHAELIAEFHSQLGHGLVVRGEGYTLVLEDEEFAVAPVGRVEHAVTQGERRVLVGAQLDAVDDLLFQLEPRARRSHQRIALIDRHHRKSGLSSHRMLPDFYVFACDRA